MSTSRDDANKIQNRVIGWLVAITAGFFLVFWIATGGPNDLPGAALKDGDWGCMTDDSPGALGGPGLTVDDGEVVDAWTFDMSTGQQSSVPFSNVQQISAVKLTVDSVWLGGQSTTFVCTFD